MFGTMKNAIGNVSSLVQILTKNENMIQILTIFIYIDLEAQRTSYMK